MPSKLSFIKLSLKLSLIQLNWIWGNLRRQGLGYDLIKRQKINCMVPWLEKDWEPKPGRQALNKLFHVHSLASGWIYIQNLETEERPNNQGLTRMMRHNPCGQAGNRWTQMESEEMARLLSSGTSNRSLPRLDTASPETVHFPCLWILCSPSNLLIAYLNSQAKFKLGKG